MCPQFHIIRLRSGSNDEEEESGQQSITLDDGNANINVRRLMCERTLTVEIKSEKFSTLIFSSFFLYLFISQPVVVPIAQRIYSGEGARWGK